MNDVGELKQFARMHARSQSIRAAGRLLDRVHTDDGDGPGSWVGEWSRAADRLRERGRTLDAIRHDTMARFPYVDGPARQAAARRCRDDFADWAAGHDVRRVDVDLSEGRVGCWASGLSADDPKPLVLMCGGIVSTKEQWAPALRMLGRFGLAGLVTEMPGVGENTSRYGEQSWRMISALLDAVADRAQVSRSYAIALSFSGHLALRCALDDGRIRGVVTAGAPVSAFFLDPDWQARVPAITRDTLGHLTGHAASGLPETLRGSALSTDQLAALDIPVACTASSRDEIIPAADVRLLRDHVRGLELVTHDDVHGAPRHVAQTRIWALRSVLRMQGRRSALLETALGVLRALSR